MMPARRRATSSSVLALGEEQGLERLAQKSASAAFKRRAIATVSRDPACPVPPRALVRSVSSASMHSTVSRMAPPPPSTISITPPDLHRRWREASAPGWRPPHRSAPSLTFLDWTFSTPSKCSPARTARLAAPFPIRRRFTTAAKRRFLGSQIKFFRLSRRHPAAAPTGSPDPRRRRPPTSTSESPAHSETRAISAPTRESFSSSRSKPRSR